LTANIEISPVRIGKPFGLQLLPDATLIVIDRREIAVRRLFVQEQRQSLAMALDAEIELGVSAGEVVESAQPSAARPLTASFEIGQAEIEVADPRIQEVVGLSKRFDRLSRVALLQ